MISAASKKYHRNFIIFSNEDSGYEEGKKPSGHLMLEVRDRKARLAVIIENLRRGSGRFGYALYLMRTGGGAVDYVRAGELRHSGSRAELELIYGQGFIDGTIYTVDDFDTFAVLVESEGRRGSDAACPLAAYRNGRTDWRSGLRKAMQNKMQADLMHKAGHQPEKAVVQEHLPQFELSGKYGSGYGGWTKPVDEPAEDTGNKLETVEAGIEAEANAQQAELAEAGYETDASDQQQELAETKDNIEDSAQQPESSEAGYEAEANVQQSESADTDGDMKANAQQPVPVKMDGTMDGNTQQPTPAVMDSEMEGNAQLPEYMKTGGEAEANDPEPAGGNANASVIQPETDNNMEQPNHDGFSAKPAIGNKSSDIEKTVKAVETSKHKKQAEQPPGKEYSYPGSAGNLDTECVYLNGNICGAVLNTGNSADPCGSCRIKRHEAPGLPEAREEGNLNGLEEELDKSFELCDPFHSRRSDYIWWRVTNPVNLNNMFYQNNIRSPFMFNPAVMTAHYKYKHLIIGVFTHKTGQRYIICGVPGMYMVDSNPFGDMGKWVQAEGNKQRYGSFGYWLIYMNPKDGRVISF